MTLTRVDVPEQDEMGHQHAPGVAEARDEPGPVDALGRGAQDVRHVGAVEALALHDERLRPDHLLDRNEPDGAAEDLLRYAVLEPLVVDDGDAVARAEDDVDEVVAAARFAQPVREGQLGLAASGAERLEHAFHVARVDADVEIPRVARDSGIALEGVRSADEKLDASVVEQAHRAEIEVAGRARELVVHGMVAPIPAPAWTGGGTEGGPPLLVRSTCTSMTRNGGSLGNRRRSSGSATLYTGTPDVVRPSGEPRCAWPWNAAVTG